MLGGGRDGPREDEVTLTLGHLLPCPSTLGRVCNEQREKTLCQHYQYESFRGLALANSGRRKRLKGVQYRNRPQKHIRDLIDPTVRPPFWTSLSIMDNLRRSYRRESLNRARLNTLRDARGRPRRAAPGPLWRPPLKPAALARARELRTLRGRAKHACLAVCTPIVTCAGLLLFLFLGVAVEEYLAGGIAAASSGARAAARATRDAVWAPPPPPPPSPRELGRLSVEQHLLNSAKDGNTTRLRLSLRRLGVHDKHRHVVLDMALYFAAESDHVDGVAMLLAREGVDPNESVHKSGHTALTVAAAKGHADVVQLLLMLRGPTLNLNALAKRGKTALHWASIGGHADVVELLLGVRGRGGRRVVNLEARDERYNRTPLMWAAANHHTRIVELLLRAGADPHTRGTWNQFVKVQHRRQQHVDAMHIARHYDHHEAVAHLEQHIEARRVTVPEGPAHMEELDGLRRGLGLYADLGEERAGAAAQNTDL